MPHYDYLIAGGGAAGLGLVHALVRHGLPDRSILLVERDGESVLQRTWCWLAESPTDFDALAACTWEQVRVTAPGFNQVIPLGRYRLRLLRGQDFSNHVHAVLAAHPNVTLARAELPPLTNAAGVVRVELGGDAVTAFWGFDSRFQPEAISIQPGKHHSLVQQVTGWEVEMDREVFDPATPTLLDFSTPQASLVQFFSVLPFSARRALVRCTRISGQAAPAGESQAALRGYLDGLAGEGRYAVLHEENGTLPLTDAPFPRRTGLRIMNIGMRGGCIKPSTGWGFLCIQREAAAIAGSLVRRLHPFDLPPVPRRYALLDRILLDLIQRRPADCPAMAARLFRRNPMERILGFINEENSALQDMRLVASLPWGRFLAAAARLLVLRRV